MSSARAREIVIAIAVAVAFADSSIVVLALPDLYGEFSTSIEGIAWVITGYNVVVAAVALALTPLVGRVPPVALFRGGLVVFAAASAACGLATGLGMLIGFRLVQGLGAAAMLAGALPVLRSAARTAHDGARVWMTAGTVGAALGPALGGAVTQLLDWRAVFLVQAPVAVAALGAASGRVAAGVAPDAGRGPLRPTLLANAGLLLMFGALVGALFLAVVMVITVWGYSPLLGAAVVSALPAATLASARLAPLLAAPAAVAGGAVLLASGLCGLAFLSATSPLLAAWALALCGAGLGLAVPVLSAAATTHEAGTVRSGTLSVGARHLGLVAALVVIAPVLAGDLAAAEDRAKVGATAVILEGRIGITTKVPLALDLRDVFEAANAGEIPDLEAAFAEYDDPRVAEVRDGLIGTIEATITRAFRPAYLLAALFAALAALTAAGGRRWARALRGAVGA